MGKVANDVLLSNAVGSTTLLVDYTQTAFGLTISSKTPTVKFTITIPRPIDDDGLGAGTNYDLVMTLNLKI